METRGNASAIAEEKAARAAGRAVSDGLLARLLKFHGSAPPDAEAAAAVRRIAPHFRSMRRSHAAWRRARRELA